MCNIVSWQFAILPAWVVISWLIARWRRAELGALVPHAYAAMLLYLTATVGDCAMKYAITVAEALPRGVITRLFIGGAVLECVSMALLMGWAVSPGGLRFMITPLASLIRRWPDRVGLPVSRHEVAFWGGPLSLFMAFVGLATTIVGYVVPAWWVLSLKLGVGLA